MKIVFFGTPEFAVPVLEKLVADKFEIVGVVTAPDKPAGRGRKLTASPVKEFALKAGLKILQPERLKSAEFLNELKDLTADLFIVVAFRMLPDAVWQIPPAGTFNLHASLLPQYRGAAPINWAIINGESETGITTFFLQHEIDTGNIIASEKVSIGKDETASELHDRLMNLGAELVLKTTRMIEENKIISTPQSSMDVSSLKHAPKLNKENTRLSAELSVKDFHNLVRGLSLYPGAHGEFVSEAGKIIPVKIFRVKPEYTTHSKIPGEIESDGKTFLKIYLKDGFVEVNEIQFPAKSRMMIRDLLNGWKINGKWKFQ